MLLTRNHHMGHDVRSMLTANRRVGVVMGVAPRRVLAAAVRHGRPRAAAPPPPARPSDGADAAFAAAVAGLLKPETDPWAELLKNLTAPRP